MTEDDVKLKEFVLALAGSLIVIILILGGFCCLVGCQALPQFFSAAQEIADDTAIKTEISKEVFQKDTDVTLQILIKNKEDKQ